MLYPPDALTASLSTTNVGGTSCGTLIATSTQEQTILSGTIFTDNNAQQDIRFASSSALYFKTINQNGGQVFIPVVFKNTAVVCSRSNNATDFFSVTYVPYNIFTSPTTTQVFIGNASTTPVEVSTNQNSYYTVAILFVTCTVLLLDLARRIFAKPHRL